MLTEAAPRYTVLSCSVVSDSLQSHGLWPARLLCPWGFSRQEYWSGLPCPPPGDLPHVGMEPAFPVPPALQVAYLPTQPLGLLLPLFERLGNKPPSIKFFVSYMAHP